MQALGYRPNGAARALQERPLPHHRRDHDDAADLRQHPHPRRDRDRGGRDADYSVLLLPISDPTLRRRVRRLPAAVRAGRRRRGDHPRGALARPGRVRAAAGNPGRRDRLGRGPRLHGGRHRPGTRRPAGHRAPAGLGHRQVWHIAGPGAAFSAAHRADSWARTLREAGITPAAGAARRLDLGVRLPARPDPRRREPTSPPSSPPTTRWRSG